MLNGEIIGAQESKTLSASFAAYKEKIKKMLQRRRSEDCGRNPMVDLARTPARDHKLSLRMSQIMCSPIVGVEIWCTRPLVISLLLLYF
jgi:hypothetical protein